MIKQNGKNVLERINLTEAKIVEVADFVDDTKDRIWVHLEGSMIDYIVDSETNECISGDAADVEEFTEFWKFSKNKYNEWVLDEIDQKVGIFDLTSMKSFSQEQNNA